jgi:hypothetical protein
MVMAGPVTELLRTHRSTVDGVAELLGCDGSWADGDAAPENGGPAALLRAYIGTTAAVARLLARS